MMDFETYKEIYSDKSPAEKLRLMIENFGRRESAALGECESYMRKNESDVDYWQSEYNGMNRRIAWLYGEIIAALEEEK